VAKFTDENRASWDVKTTSVQQDNKPADNAYVATIDLDATELDYSGNQFALNDSATFDGRGGQTTKITWPTGGNPLLRGPGGEAEALAAIRAFAARLKAGNLAKVAVIKVKGAVPKKDDAAPAGDGGTMLAFLALVALVYYADKH